MDSEHSSRLKKHPGTSFYKPDGSLQLATLEILKLEDSVSKQTRPPAGLWEAWDAMVCNYLPTESLCGRIAGRAEAAAAFLY